MKKSSRRSEQRSRSREQRRRDRSRDKRKSRSRSPSSRSRERHRERDRERERERAIRFGTAPPPSDDGHYSRHDSGAGERRKSRFTDAPLEPPMEIPRSNPTLAQRPQSNYYPPNKKEEVMNLPLLKRLNNVTGNSLPFVPPGMPGSAPPIHGHQGGMHGGMHGPGPVFTGLMHENTKIKRKIPLPKQTNFNYSGLLIGPKGNNQKQLEEKTGCKILVRGRGSQNNSMDRHDDQEDLHVLVMGDNDTQVARACAEIERIIFADQATLNKMKNEQLRQYQQSQAESKTNTGSDLSLTTPYGPPSDNAYILEVPNQCVGLVIGKEGETIKNIAKRSGAIKVQVATTSAPGAKTRNIFVEGDADSVERVRRQLFQIVETQRKMTSGVPTGGFKLDIQIPHRLIGLVIGKGGETIKGINARTGAYVCLSKEDNVDKSKKTVNITGPEDRCILAKYEIEVIIQNGLRNLHKQPGGLTPSEIDMIKPITPLNQQLAQLNLPVPTQLQPTIKQDPVAQYIAQTPPPPPVSNAANVLYQELIGPTAGIIEETVVEDPEPRRKRKFG